MSQDLNLLHYRAFPTWILNPSYRIQEEFLQFWLRINLGLVKHFHSNRIIRSVNFFFRAWRIPGQRKKTDFFHRSFTSWSFLHPGITVKHSTFFLVSAAIWPLWWINQSAVEPKAIQGLIYCKRTYSLLAAPWVLHFMGSFAFKQIEWEVGVEHDQCGLVVLHGYFMLFLHCCKWLQKALVKDDWVW